MLLSVLQAIQWRLYAAVNVEKTLPLNWKTLFPLKARLFKFIIITYKTLFCLHTDFCKFIDCIFLVDRLLNSIASIIRIKLDQHTNSELKWVPIYLKQIFPAYILQKLLYNLQSDGTQHNTIPARTFSHKRKVFGCNFIVSSKESGFVYNYIHIRA